MMVSQSSKNGAFQRVVQVDLGEDQGNFDKACEGLREQVEQVRGIVEV